VTEWNHALRSAIRCCAELVGEMIPRRPADAGYRQYGQILLSPGRVSDGGGHCSTPRTRRTLTRWRGGHRGRRGTLAGTRRSTAGGGDARWKLTPADDTAVLSRAGTAAEDMGRGRAVAGQPAIDGEMLASRCQRAARNGSGRHCPLSCGAAGGPGRGRPGQLCGPGKAVPGGRGFRRDPRACRPCGLRDEDAGPAARGILAAPRRTTATSRRLPAWPLRSCADSARSATSLELLREADQARRGDHPPSRIPSTLRALAAARTRLPRPGGEDNTAHAPTTQRCAASPLRRGCHLWRARITLAAGRPDRPPPEGQAVPRPSAGPSASKGTPRKRDEGWP